MSRHLVCFSLIAVGLATTANAELIQQELPKQHLHLQADGTVVSTTPGGPDLVDEWFDTFDNAPGGAGFFAAPLATGPVGFDDYNTTLPAGDTDIILEEFNFVGGVNDVGGIAFFEFYDTALNFVDSFGVSLSSAGNFFWTITLGTPIQIPGNGVVQMVVDGATTGQFFLSDNLPEAGFSLSDVSTGPLGEPLNHSFRIYGDSVPEPASMGFGLCGLLGMLLLARRK